MVKIALVTKNLDPIEPRLLGLRGSVVQLSSSSSSYMLLVTGIRGWNLSFRALVSNFKRSPLSFVVPHFPALPMSCAVHGDWRIVGGSIAED